MTIIFLENNIISNINFCFYKSDTMFDIILVHIFFKLNELTKLYISYFDVFKGIKKENYWNLKLTSYLKYNKQKTLLSCTSQRQKNVNLLLGRPCPG